MLARRIAHRTARTRNPLRRGSDRIEAGVTLALILTMLLIAPGAGWWAARETYRQDLRTSAWESHHRFAVTAVVLEDAPGWTGAGSDGLPPPPQSLLAPARWTGPDGVVHTGMVFADSGVRRGNPVQIWVDETGVVVARPGRRSAPMDAILAALLAVGVLAAGVSGVRVIVVWRLNRRRLRAWQAEWLVVGPRWSHR
jgi:hypothetical protein